MTATTTDPALTLDNPAFAHAVSTARSSLDIQARIVAEAHRCDMAIVRKDSGRLAVYRADAWDRPDQAPLLPWSPPLGAPVATVHLDGTVTVTG
jgi:hypothetical protein